MTPDEDWLSDRLSRIDEVLDTFLDIDAGLAEARLPGLQHALVDALEDVIDVESGLAAIVGGGARADRIDVRGAGSDLSRFASDIATAPPSERLAARSWLPLPELAQVGKIAELELQALQAARELEEISKAHLDGDDFAIFTSALADQRGHAAQIIDALVAEAGRGATKVLDLTTAITRDPDLDHDRSYALDHALSRARTLEHNLGMLQTWMAGRSGERVKYWASKMWLREVCGYARLLDQSLTGALARCLNHTRHCVSDEAMRQALAGDVSHVMALDLVDKTCEVRDRRRAELVRSVADAVDAVVQAASQVVGADLSDVDLRGVPLEGLRWSSTTRWPPDWEAWVHRNSVSVGRDLYAIRAGKSDVDAVASAMA